MRVTIYEPNHVGHRFSHVRRMIGAFADAGAEVSFLTSRAGAESVEYRTQVAPLEGRFRLDASAAGLAEQVNQYSHRCAAEVFALARSGATDHILIPYADGITQVAGARRLAGRYRLPSGVEVEGLMFRGTLAYEPARSLRRRARDAAWLAATAAAPWAVLHHMDPIAYDAIGRRAGRFFGLRRRLRLIPDPVEPPERISPAEARRRLGIPENGRMIGSAGWLDARKGIDRLVNAFAGAGLGETDRLLLVGHQEPEIKAAVAAHEHLVRGGRIVSLDRYLSDQEFTLGIAAMDVVCTPYPRHIGSASIVIHAAAQGRPVLAGDFGWLGAIVGRFGLGWNCNVEAPGVLEEWIGRSVQRSDAFSLGEAGRRFVEFHTADNFAACWTARLRTRMGLQPPPAQRTWDWVCEAAGATAT